MGRGVTGLDGRGLYSGLRREVLLCVITRSEEAKLKEIVHRLDPRAFVIFAPVHEVLGEGFKEYTEKVYK
ncbi:MAG: YitT family protein [Bacillota bacterium]